MGLSIKAEANHLHDERYSPLDHTHLSFSKLYITKTDIDDRIDISTSQITVTDTNISQAVQIKKDGITINGKKVSTEDHNHSINNLTNRPYFYTIKCNRVQRWGMSNYYTKYILGYIKIIGQYYVLLTGKLDITVMATDTVKERFEVLLYYGTQSPKLTINVAGRSMMTNSGGCSHIAVVPRDSGDNYQWYEVSLLVDGYTNKDSCGALVEWVANEWQFVLYSAIDGAQRDVFTAIGGAQHAGKSDYDPYIVYSNSRGSYATSDHTHSKYSPLGHTHSSQKIIRNNLERTVKNTIITVG